MDAILECPYCHALLPTERVAAGAGFECPACAHVVEVHVFPALARSDKVDRGELARAQDGEASCFYHPGRKAARICDGCGVFICDLCDLDMGKQHLCPTCLEKGRTGAKITPVKREAILYDGLALGLSLMPFTLLLYFALPFSAPAAIYFGIRYWNKPRSIIPRGNWRIILAILIASLQLAAVVLFILFLSFSSHTK